MSATGQLGAMVKDARQRTVALVADLNGDQLFGPKLATVNPLLWEIGHVGWFQERWVLRHALGRQPLRENGDALYDSSTVPHDTRWDLPLPSRAETVDYLGRVRELVLSVIANPEESRAADYFLRLSIAHEDMHDEAFVITRQTLGFPRPEPLGTAGAPPDGGPLEGDARVTGGPFMLGAFAGEEPFIHDNEKWAHPIEVRSFAMARAPVTQSQFADFLSAGGYRRRAWWSDEGWRWRESTGAEHPVYWRRGERGWERREFDRWLPLEPHRPVIHVNWYEAEAFCRFAGRRLPSEAEWEVAAAGSPAGGGALSRGKRRFPWGDEAPSANRANLDGGWLGCTDVGALEDGDSAFGLRQMIGNVWEWTATTFDAYPGFSADPYKDYSEPWFGTHKVLRGGCWVTRGRLIRNTWRNFYTPERRDILAGFRTCAR
ncbi:MAG TPA: selenoneine synthase SenA [Myxococcaceae bacterium]|nr:selenoneine synthase SenA [Myxococcaceae bacterium]